MDNSRQLLGVDMATNSATATEPRNESVRRSILRSVVTPYWPFTVYVAAYAVAGIAIASAFSGFSYTVLFASIGAIYFGLEGLHALDLADEGVATDMDNRVAFTVGMMEVALGAALGITIAMITTLWFIPIVMVGTFLGMAYNLEWFDGLLHDRDKMTGLGNFGVSWGAIPFFGGFYVIHQSISIGVLVVTLGVGIDAARLNYQEGHGRIARYENTGIEHDRDHKSTGDEARSACHYGNMMSLGAWVSISIGFLLLFAV